MEKEADIYAVQESLQILSPGEWPEYQLMDSGEFEKLERFGDFVLRRPEPQAVWTKSLSENEWKKADATFIQEGSSSGKWERRNRNMPDQWVLHYKRDTMTLRFRLGLTAFKHVGVFPEQSVNWDFIYSQSSRIKNANVLNLFAYTGGASLAARAAGADVIHCDSIRQVVNWANANMELSKQDGIRWLVEDAFTFVNKEAKRGKKYNGIILDPPAWGHGPRGEKWKLEEMINELIAKTASILENENCFYVFNAYSLGFSALILENLVRSHFEPSVLKETTSGELCLKELSGRKMPAGVFVRFAN